MDGSSAIMWVAIGVSVALAGACGSGTTTGSGGASSSSSSGGASSSSSGTGGMTSSSTTTSTSSSASCSTGEVCVPSPPAGWTGPVQLYEGTTTTPACPPATVMKLQGGSNLNAPPASCSACTCGGPDGVACSAPTVSFYTDSTCSSAPCDVAAVGSSCGQIQTASKCASATQIYASASSKASGGGCLPSQEVPSVPPASWSTQALACGPTEVATSCGTGNVCAPAPAESFALCIYQDGDVACPSAAYTHKSLIDTTFVDTRTCSACACAAPTVCGAGSVFLSPTSACVGGVGIPIPVACTLTGISGASLSYAAVSTNPVAGPCEPSGGQPTGSAQPAGAVTLCCQ